MNPTADHATLANTLHTRKIEDAKTPMILYPLEYYSQLDTPQTDLINSFVEDLEGYLNVKRTRISLAEQFQTYMENVCAFLSH